MAMITKLYPVVFILILTCLPCIISDTCTFTRTNDTRGFEDGTPKGTHDIDTCENLCEADTSCIAVYVISPVCYFTNTLQTRQSLGAIYSVKSCSPDPMTAEPTTEEQTTPEPNTGNSQQDACLMKRAEDKTIESEAYFKLKLSEVTCLSFCQHVDDCKSVTINSTSCKFYTDVTTTTNIDGSNHYVRTKCPDGYNCCWETKSSASGTKNPTFKLENTLESCEAICGKMLRCSGITWSNKECHIYVTTPDLTPKTNSVYSKKTCSTGDDVGRFKFNTICTGRNGSLRSKINISLFLSILSLYFINNFILC